ncbi:MAG: glutathione-dependent formaldehyde-activating, GFA [Sphingopyxis sp.]|nr:glutathione-dependent formaldehyde-activating, GFA [Sphingopyxis sp.]
MFADPAQVEVVGADNCESYVQGDRAITVFHCRSCGVTTHWTPRVAEIDFMGVNARLFDQAWWRQLPVRHMDGKSR